MIDVESLRRVAGEVELADDRRRERRDSVTGRVALPPATGTTIVGRPGWLRRLLARWT